MKKDTLSIDGKIYVSTRRASEIAGYSKDYIGQLCREGRVLSRMVSRSWWVDEESIRRHAAETVKANQTSFRPTDEQQVLVSRPIGTNIALSARIRLDLVDLPPLQPFAVVNVADFDGHAFVGVLQKALVGIALVLVVGTVALGATSLVKNNFGPYSAVADVSGTGSAIAMVWDRITAGFGVMFGGSQSNPDVQVADDTSLPQAGVVVVPSAGTSTNAKLAQSIVNSFSDNVQVAPSTNGTDGVITPEFRTVKGHDYLYVLVPVKATSTPTQQD